MWRKQTSPKTGRVTSRHQHNLIGNVSINILPSLAFKLRPNLAVLSFLLHAFEMDMYRNNYSQTTGLSREQYARNVRQTRDAL